jgi:hypothetical protein
MTDQSYTTATRRGLERIQVISQGVDDSDPSLLCGADPRNRTTFLVRGEEVFEIHQSDLLATIAGLTRLVE